MTRALFAQAMSQAFTDLGRSFTMGLVQQFYSSLAYWGARVPAADPERHGVEVLRDLSYVEDSSATQHKLDIYRPRAAETSLPVVLYVHGGGFRMLSKDTHWIFGLGFARQGYLVFNINYSLAPRGRYPAGLADVCRAYQWVAENAHRFGGDPSRIVLAGESAGANLVTSLAIAACCERPEPFARPLLDQPAPIGAMPACGLHQVRDASRFARRRKLQRFVSVQLEQIELDYFGDSPEAKGGLADPLIVLEEGPTLVRPLPPFLATVGTRDPILDDTRRLAAALDALDVPCEIRYYPGEIHAFQALIWRTQAKAWWRHSLAFMKQVTAAAPRVDP